MLEKGGGKDALRAKMRNGVEQGEGVLTVSVQQKDGHGAMMKTVQVGVRRERRKRGQEVESRGSRAKNVRRRGSPGLGVSKERLKKCVVEETGKRIGKTGEEGWRGDEDGIGEANATSF